MGDRLHVLIIDDNPVDRLRIRGELERELSDLVVCEVGTADEYRRATGGGRFDVVLTDYLLPWSDGLTILRELKRAWRDVPVLMVTGSGNEEIAIEAIKAGLDDYVLKSTKHLARLPAAVRSARQRTEQRRALAENERRYRALFDRLPVGLLQSSWEGRLLDANPALVEMLGYPDREALLAVREAALFARPGTWEAWRRRLAEEGTVRGHAAEIRRQDDRIIWARVSGRILEEPAGRFRGCEVWLEDVTEQRALREKLVQADKMAAIGRLIAGVAHELNNPLTSVIGQAQLLQLGARDDQTRLGTQMIAGEAERAVQIVRNLLSIARPQCPERRAVDLPSLLRDAAAARAVDLRLQHIAVEILAEEGLPAVAADPHQLRQVVVNLLRNAEQAVAAAGRAGTIRVRLFTGGERESVRFRVEDTGGGIPEAILPRIFEPFVTGQSSGSGTGLGLSICYAIVEEHGGRILAGNRSEGGAWFEVELPRAAAASAEEDREPGAAPAAGRRILVADDEPSILRILADVLRLEGHAVETASDGVSAAKRISDGEHDLVFLDLRMPGLDGRCLYDEVICRKAPRPRVIVMTGDTVNRETMLFLERTGLECLEKPFTIESVRRALRHTS